MLTRKRNRKPKAPRHIKVPPFYVGPGGPWRIEGPVHCGKWLCRLDARFLTEVQRNAWYAAQDDLTRSRLVLFYKGGK